MGKKPRSSRPAKRACKSLRALAREHGAIVCRKYEGKARPGDAARLREVRRILNAAESERHKPVLDAMRDAAETMQRIAALPSVGKRLALLESVATAAVDVAWMVKSPHVAGCICQTCCEVSDFKLALDALAELPTTAPHAAKHT